MLDDSPEVITGIVSGARKWATEFLESTKCKALKEGFWEDKRWSRRHRDVRNFESIRSCKKKDRYDYGDDGVWRDALTAYAVCMLDRHSLMFGREVKDVARRRIIQSRISQSVWCGGFDDFGKKLMAEIDAQSVFAFNFWSAFACKKNDYALYLDGDESTHAPTISIATIKQDREFLCDLYANICQPSPGVRLLAYADFEEILYELTKYEIICRRRDVYLELKKEISKDNAHIERLKMYIDEAMRLRHCDIRTESRRVSFVACFLAFAFYRPYSVLSSKDCWKNSGMNWDVYCQEAVTKLSCLYGVQLQGAVNEMLSRLQGQPIFNRNDDEVLYSCLGNREHSLDDVHWFASYFDEMLEDSGYIDVKLYHTAL